MTHETNTSRKRLLTIHDLLSLMRCGRTTAYARVHDPGFPDAVVLSGSAHRWWEHEVLDWIEARRDPATRRDRGTPPRTQRPDDSLVTQTPRPIAIRRNHDDRRDTGPDATP